MGFLKPVKHGCSGAGGQAGIAGQFRGGGQPLEKDERQAFHIGDIDVPAGSRWISMEFPGGGTSINLTNVYENMQPGTMKLYFSTPDIEAAYKELKSKGVKPTHEITRAGWGTSFDFRDPDGNQWLVVQAK